MNKVIRELLGKHTSRRLEVEAAQSRLDEVDGPLGDKLVKIIGKMPENERDALIQEVGPCFLQFRLLQALRQEKR